MRKHLLLVFVTLFAISLSAADLNPFAYNLYNSTNTDGGTRLNFSLNAPAPTVEVYIVVGNAEKKIRTISPAGKGNHPIDLTASDAASAGLTAGSSYSWKVKVTTPDRSSAAEYVGRKVDNKPIFSIDMITTLLVRILVVFWLRMVRIISPMNRVSSHTMQPLRQMAVEIWEQV